MRLAALAVVVAILVAPLAGTAQQPAKVSRIGYLGATTPSAFPHFREAFLNGLREAGFVEGQNLVIESRWAEGRDERFPELAAELVRLKLDVIVTFGTGPAHAVKQATQTIPVVFSGVGDAVGAGFVASLARPGGNMTGLSLLTPEVNEKRLELLKEAVPGISRVAVLWNPGAHGHEQQLKDLAGAARALRVQLQGVSVGAPEELESAFLAMGKDHADALMVLPSPFTHRNMRRISDLAVKHRLPSMCEFNEFVDLGGLIAYGASWSEMMRRTGTYVGRILKGAKPAELPVEQPTRFEFNVNLKTVKALGVTVPQSVLFRADRVIE